MNTTTQPAVGFSFSNVNPSGKRYLAVFQVEHEATGQHVDISIHTDENGKVSSMSDWAHAPEFVRAGILTSYSNGQGMFATPTFVVDAETWKRVTANADTVSDRDMSQVHEHLGQEAEDRFDHARQIKRAQAYREDILEHLNRAEQAFKRNDPNVAEQLANRASKLAETFEAIVAGRSKF